MIVDARLQSRVSLAPLLREAVVSTPERTLVLAVLEDAMAFADGHTSAISGYAYRRGAFIDDARTWLTSDDIDPWSFVWCCEHLDLAPTAIRAALIPRWQPAPPIERRRNRYAPHQCRGIAPGKCAPRYDCPVILDTVAQWCRRCVTVSASRRDTAKRAATRSAIRYARIKNASRARDEASRQP